MNIEKYMLPCFSKTLFGIECLGCGFQRGFLLLLQGDFGGAFDRYPAIFTTLLFLGILALNFIDTNRNYKKIIIGTAVLNGVFMIAGYYFKHY
ncbi:DUF2752 domain-containing protein [Flavobacterium sp. ZB4P23]|uniref:DUF2752 domain-containing protein n=1 Tax=unclassified Flavobacterium TaxID=196869 RepID=UPI000F838ABE|nr:MULTISPECIES: DUF2752 domain-containing protein [unclassified Flavobacterium]RTY81488.1 DUF2752 domain-containing protein [Flavobacterium sp. ZB4P23]RTY85649.1 DUF2752 domain-containing protein [Flavobacterium sp. RSP15]